METVSSISPVPPVLSGGAGSFPALASLTALVALGRDFVPSRPLRLGRAAYRSLSTVGHLASRYFAACDVIQRNGSLEGFGALSALLKGDGTGNTRLKGNGLFICPVAAGPRGWTLQPTVLPEGLTRGLLPVWRQVQPDLSRHLPEALAVPEAAHDTALWPALLRLKPLRSLWEKHLRRSHVLSLLRLLPDAWLMDPAPLPPGAVIPRLELPNWRDLARSRAADQRYLLSPALTAHCGVVLRENESRETWECRIREALTFPPSDRRILTALPPHEAATLCGVYCQNGRRVEFLGAFGTRCSQRAGREVFRIEQG